MDDTHTEIPVKPENKIISSLTEFIAFIDEIDSNNFYFRGESQENNERIASIYRPILESTTSAGTSNDYLLFEDIIHDYYKNIGNMLCSADKENFIAFAQHHGLPTPLLDITTNPLTSLYFASSKNSDSSGFIYLFDKKTSIDISQFLRGIEPVDFFIKILQMDADEAFVRPRPHKR